jgi:hypothetical protein
MVSFPSSHGCVELLIQEWRSFYVIIAVSDGVICTVDTADTYSELINEVQSKFPGRELRLSNWSQEESPTWAIQRLFDSVMTALEQPSGRTLDISPAALYISSYGERQILECDSKSIYR